MFILKENKCTMKRLSARLYVCPECDYQTEYRWVLRNHLRNVHGYGKREATEAAMESEYWLNPHYVRREEIE